VWQHNNLAQKNLIVVDAIPGDTVSIPFQLGTKSRVKRETFTLELRRPRTLPSLAVALTHQDAYSLRRLFSRFDEGDETETATPATSTKPMIRFLQPSLIEIAHRAANADPIRLTLGANSTLDLGDFGVAEQEASFESDETVSTPDVASDATTSAGSAAFRTGAIAGFPVTLRPREAVTLNLNITVPRDARPGDVIDFDVVQRNAKKRIVGGIAYQLKVGQKT
jgi:hypothetical protein